MKPEFFLLKLKRLEYEIDTIQIRLALSGVLPFLIIAKKSTYI